jgi:hypothetical protein
MGVPGAADEEIEVAALVIRDLLYRVAPEKRAAALARAAEREAQEAAKPQFEIRCASEIDFANSPGIRYWHDIMKLKARVAYTFIRNITNNHAPEDAAELLFQQQCGVPGSGYLEQYIDKLPRGD